MDDKKWVPTTTYCGHTRRSGEEEGIYEVGSEMGLQQCQNQRGR